MTDKAFNFFDKCDARCVDRGGNSMQNLQRMLTEINKSGAVAKIRI